MFVGLLLAIYEQNRSAEKVRGSFFWGGRFSPGSLRFLSKLVDIDRRYICQYWFPLRFFYMLRNSRQKMLSSTRINSIEIHASSHFDIFYLWRSLHTQYDTSQLSPLQETPKWARQESSNWLRVLTYAVFFTNRYISWKEIPRIYLARLATRYDLLITKVHESLQCW